MAFTPLAIRVRMSASWPAASVLRWITVRSETWPEAFACALAVQTCSSRKPLPTPPPFEYPIVYCFAAPEPDGAAEPPAADGAAVGGAAVAPVLGAVVASVLEHAAAIT